jgi:CheY-like chemotaxis protein
MASDRGVVILLVEDDPDIEQLTQLILEEAGFSVARAANGAEGLELYELVRPDLVLTDVMMPVMDGFALMTKLRARPDCPPIIAFSAFSDYRRAALEAGARVVLPKPFDIDELVRTVEALVAGERPPKPTIIAPELDEEARLRAVLALELDQPSGPEFDAFARRVAAIFGVPVCLVSIITRESQYWTAHCGLPADLASDPSSPRRDSFCTHAVVGRAALIVQDTFENPYFRDNVLVRTRGLRFYAGVPIFVRDGEAVGTLCLLDFTPRTFSAFDLELLALLGRRVAAGLEARERGAHPDEPASAFENLSALDPELGILSRELFLHVLEVQAMRLAPRHQPLGVAVVEAPRAALPGLVRRLEGRLGRALLGRLGADRIGLCQPGDADELGEAIRLEADGSDLRAETASVRGAPLVATAVLQRLVHRLDPSPGAAASP